MVSSLTAVVGLAVGVLATSPAASLSVEPAEIEAVDDGGLAEGSSPAELSQLGAAAALAFDAWTISDRALAQLEWTFSSNISMQQSQVPVAQRDLNRLNLLLSGAQETYDLAVERRDEAFALYQDLAVGLFVSGHQTLEPEPSAEIDRARRSGTIDAVSADYALTYARSETALAEASAALDARAGDVVAGEGVLQAANDAVAEAERLLAEYERLAQDRDALIAQRITESIADYNAGSNLVTVEGYRVDASLAEPLTALIAAAREDGINFGGWGWRSRETQIDLRRSHCGDSGYALFDMSASSCRPPTARPGTSQHELGLAIDFTENGSTLSWSSAGFGWLREHAAEYGLYNLPSEAWHWSTTGG